VQLVELQENLDKIRRQGLGLAAISYDSVAALKDFADRKNISFPLLSDAGSEIIRAFGLLNEKPLPASPQYGIPHPGTFVVNRDGLIEAKYFEENYRERHTASEILVRRYGDEPGSPSATVETEFVKVSITASPAIVGMGQRIVLTVDISPKPELHFTAPVRWSMETSPAFRIHDVTYQTPSRLLCDVTIGTDAEVIPMLGDNRQLPLEGSLEYQVCDDHTCYPPQTVPLTWALTYEALDRQRAANAKGVTGGHLHFRVHDLEAHRRFWKALGGVPITTEGFEYFQFQGAFVMLTAAEPSGSMEGCVVAAVGFAVRNLSNSRGSVIAPDGVRVELSENPAMNLPITTDYIRFATNAPTEMQAWYARVFGAKPGNRNGIPSAQLPGVSLLFTEAHGPVVGTKGRILDHIAFEIRNLKIFCEQLQAAGVNLDQPYQTAPHSTVGLAYLTDPWGTRIELTEGLARPKR
jgi:catechol 2,3-dioxygenase-like lactoylglutathione lyase family enzyme